VTQAGTATAAVLPNIGGEMRTAVRHSAVYGLGSILAKALGFAMVPFYTHYLSPADYGVLEILDLSMSLLGMFLNMGMTAAMMRSFTRAPSEGEKHKVVSTGLLFAAATAVSTFLLLLPGVPSVSGWLLGSGTPSVYLLISLSSLLVGYIANLPRTYLRALEASGAFVAVETASLFAMLLLNVVFIAGFGMGVAGILVSSLLVTIVQAVLLCWWTVKRVGIGFSGAALGEMARFGGPLVLSNLGLFTVNFSDRFFLQQFQSLDAVGVYAVGYKFGYMINFLLVQPFYGMWQVRMYAVHAQPNHPRIFSEMFTLYSLLLIYGALCLSLVSPEVVRLMVDSRFAASAMIIPVVALAYVFSGIGYYVQVGMFVAKRTSLVGAVSAVAAVLNLALNYFLIRWFGMSGAAWATLLSFFAVAVGSYWCSQQVFPLPFSVTRISAALGIAVALYCTGGVLTSISMPAALACKAGLMAVFPLVTWKAGMLSASEKEALLSAVRGPASRFGLMRKAAVNDSRMS
jgi:O-antigen/teichoic acid export membrane protein